MERGLKGGKVLFVNLALLVGRKAQLSFGESAELGNQLEDTREKAVC